jgi:hypothetical protein
MIDIDELLRTDATRWRDGLPPTPNLDEVLASARAPHRRSNRLRVGMLIAAVVVVVAGIALAAVLVGGSGRKTQPPSNGAPAFVLVHGKRVPYAGKVPWADAIADPHDPRRLVVYADGDNLRGRFVCGIPIERPTVHVTSHRVSILIAGYAPVVPASSACAEPGHGPQPVTVDLGQPLGHRVVVDPTTGLRHRVLNPTAVPTVPSVPPGYQPWPMHWSDRTGVAERDWSENACPTDCAIHLQYAPPTSRARFEGLDNLPASGHAVVNGNKATVYTYRDRRGSLMLTEVAVSWRRPDGSRLLLMTGGGYRRGAANHTLSVAETVALARSVH